MNTPTPSKLHKPFSYNETQAAEYCGVTADELPELRKAGTGPVFTYSPATDEYHYSPESLNAWLREINGGDAA